VSIEKLGYKFRIYLNSKQEQQFSQDAGNCRFIYNFFLEHKMKEHEHWMELGKPKKWEGWSSAYDNFHIMSEMRNSKWYPWLQLTPVNTLRQSIRHLDQAFKNMMKGYARYPTFHKRGGKQTIHFTNGTGQINEKQFLKEGKRLFVQLPYGYGIAELVGQEFPENGRILNSCLSKDVDRYYLSITFEVAEGSQLRDRTGKQYKKCGIDIGVKRPLTVVSIVGSEVKSKVYGKDLQARLKCKSIHRRRHQRAFARKYEAWKLRNKKLLKTTGEKISWSNNMLKEKHRVAKIFQKERDMKNDWQQKTSNTLAKHFETVKFENLKLKNMSKSARGTIEEPGINVKAKSGLNRELLRLGIGRLVSLTEYKARQYGGQIQFVSAHNTSRKCSNCGYTDKRNRKSQAEFGCRECGYKQNADVNAAINISRRKSITNKKKKGSKSRYLRKVA